mgnify:CR=1 FL=1
MSVTVLPQARTLTAVRPRALSYHYETHPPAPLLTPCRPVSHPIPPCHTLSPIVTPCHTLSHPVTPCHTLSYPVTLSHPVTTCLTLPHPFIHRHTPAHHDITFLSLHTTQPNSATPSTPIQSPRTIEIAIDHTSPSHKHIHVTQYSLRYEHD